MHEVLWPQVEAMSAVLEQATDAAVDRIVTQWSGEPLKQYDGSQAELFE
jgi:hypothetical protein